MVNSLGDSGLLEDGGPGVTCANLYLGVESSYFNLDLKKILFTAVQNMLHFLPVTFSSPEECVEWKFLLSSPVGRPSGKCGRGTGRR